jgi:hypothetical protein
MKDKIRQMVEDVEQKVWLNSADVAFTPIY